MSTEIDYDYVNFVIPDINGIPRGRMVPRAFVQDTMCSGIELFYGETLNIFVQR